MLSLFHIIIYEIVWSAYRVQIKLLDTRLCVVKEEGLDLIRISDVGVAFEAVVEAKLKLKRILDRYSCALQNYIEKAENPSTEIVTTCTENQLEADEVQAKLETLLQLHSNKSSSTNTHQSKLPTLQPPKFSGDILSFHQFWDKFEATIDKRDLEDVDKLAYLMASLEGKALEAVNGLGVTNSNYSIAVETLKHQFGNKDILVDAHYNALKQLPVALGLDKCRHTYNAVEHHLRVLQTLGENMEGNHLRTTITSKFPDQVLYELNMALPTGQNTVPNIRKELNKIITALEHSKPQNSYISLSNEVASSAQALFQTDGKKFVSGGKNNRKIVPHKEETMYVPYNGKRKQDHNKVNELLVKKQKRSCVFCDKDHFSNECMTFKSLNERKKKLGKRCYRCFRMDHMMKNCSIKKKCYHCKGDHHQALCPKKTIGTKIKTNDKRFEATTFCNINNTKSYLQTATVTVKSKNHKKKCRLLLDSGSQRSYITMQIAKDLKLAADKEDLLIIYTFGSETPKETSSPSAEIDIETKRNIKRRIRVNIVPHITERVPVPDLQLIPKIDILADDKSIGEGIDLLIGNDYYMSFMKNNIIKFQECLFLIDTDFGWVLTGSVNDSAENRNEILSVITYCQCYDSEHLYFSKPDLPLRDMDVKFLWTLENIGITDSPKTTREEEAVKHFTETVKYEDGRYQVKWPWSDYPPDLCTNFGLAYGRLTSLIRRLDQNTLNEYNDIIKEQIDASVIEVINPQSSTANQTIPPIHYLPHHMVKHENKRGRIVYDASAKVKGQRSLNDSMYTGPSMLEDLTALLIKFRTNTVGITADVEKAFLQVGLQKEDRDVTRFLWLKDITKGVTYDNILHLRFCRVPFGFIASPFLLTATIRHHFSKTCQELLPKIADRCYVDNLVTTASSSTSAYNLYLETKKSFQELSMNIREWASNDKEFIKNVPEEYRTKNTEVIKVLGITWSLENDSLQLNLNEKVFNEEHAKTTKSKRDVLKTLASLYDPCGFAAPVVLPAKILLQELWRRKLKWDTPLPDDLKLRWKSILTSMQNAKDIKVPRYIGNKNDADGKVEHELHCFTDASKSAHAAVIYLRVSDRRSKRVTFIMSKSRVNPLKEMENLKIPRLELLGYLIGSRLLAYVKKALAIPITKQFLWTDSQIVLSWMRSNKLLPPFVTRRVNEIKHNSGLQMCYINSEQNPADLATRPELWSKKRKLWLEGPAFLSDQITPWPVEPCVSYDSAFSMAVAEGLDTEYPERSHDFLSKDIPQINLLEVDHNDNPRKKTLNSEVQEIQNLQRKYFKDEMMGKHTHLSRNLDLFLDVDGILRCNGRMANTDWSYEMKHPILLPKDCEFTWKMISDTHEKHYHVGIAHTLSIIRQKYWIPQGRSQVQKVIKRCQQCAKHGGGPYKLPSTPALPPERVTYGPPFTYTGIDYFGPMYVIAGQEKKKRWVCLYTCLVVRAIHLEIVNDLTAQECLLALRRFIASRAKPKIIVSDNALQFKLTSEVLSDSYCSQTNIKWKFIPQLAPWHGGVYERMVAVVKHCLKRTLQKHLVGDSQLFTVIKEVENVCNSRPLTYVSSEPGHILKPADFLSLGNCLLLESSENLSLATATPSKQTLIDSWKRGQRIITEFKAMFIGHYLVSLRERYQHSHKQPTVKSFKEPRIGDVVQIKGEAKNRENWKVGKISTLIKGPDGECRVARVKVGETEFTRSIGHLYPLEGDIIDDEKANEESKTQVPVIIQCGNLHDQDTEINNEPYQQLDVEENAEFCDSFPVSSETSDNLSDVPHCTKENENSESLNQNVLPEITSREDQGDYFPQTNDTIQINFREEVNDNYNERNRREAAIKAREKIAEWTRLLAVLLK